MHTSLIFNIINEICHFHRQSSKDLFCDVRLVIRNTRIPAHKMILSAASPYFYAMFADSNFNEANQGEVKIGGVEYDSLKPLIDYVYTSSIELSDGNVEVSLDTNLFNWSTALGNKI